MVWSSATVRPLGVAGEYSPHGGAERLGGHGNGYRVTMAHTAEWEQRHWTSRALHRVGGVAAHSGAGIVATVLVVLWAGVGLISGFPQWWQTVLYSVTGSVTFVMVFAIQHAQERQTSGTRNPSSLMTTP